MKFVGRLVSFRVTVVVVGGCASTKVSDREILVTEKVPRPDHILIYDFAATPADVPADSPLAAAATAQTPQTTEQIEFGRRVGAEIATQLTERVRRMGLPAERASRQSAPQINDIVIRGYILSLSEGSAAKRVAIGFGAGASELSVAVEGYQMTAEGLRRLGSGTGTSGGSKTPGAAAPAGVALATGNPLGLVVSTGIKGYGEISGSTRTGGRIEQIVTEIAKQMEPRFRDQGWIK
jgi:Domain of unknown function (DUF4410)